MKTQTEQNNDQVFMRPRPQLPENIESKLFFSGDIGTGKCDAFSSDLRRLISFEPVLSPLTHKRDLDSKVDDVNKPRYTLREEGQVYVFGVADVFNHGQIAHRRRLSSLDRYLTPDYYRFFRVMLFQAFKRFAGNTEPIRPTVAISVPIKIYDDAITVEQIRDAIIGSYDITDIDGCTLRVEITEERLMVVPESYGAKQHRDFDPVTLQRRVDVDTSGSTIMVDAGFETVNEALFTGQKYVPDASWTLERGGFGVVVRSIQQWAGGQLKGVDVSRIDLGLRAIAGLPLGADKFITVAPGVSINVQPVYDLEIVHFADRIIQDVATRFADIAANRVCLTGGTLYHLLPYVTEEAIGWPVEETPNPEIANPLGVLTKLYREALKRNN